MATKTSQSKRVLVEKANQMIVVVTAVAAFVTVFSLVAGKTLINQESYQNRIITAKNTALKQLKTDVTNVDKLDNSYETFVSNPTNLLGSDSTVAGADNGDIVLDALPSQYDFPALISSVEKVINDNGLTINAISGTDLESSEGSNSSSISPKPIAMPFSFTVNGPYLNILSLVSTLESSIRPFQIQTEQISGNQTDLSLTISAQTYYQPGVKFSISSEIIK